MELCLEQSDNERLISCWRGHGCRGGVHQDFSKRSTFTGPVDFVRLFKPVPGRTDKEAPVKEPWEDPSEDEEVERVVRCRVCGNVVAHEADQISVNGSHRHVFANPHGLVFETVCYKTAMGCVVSGQPSDEFTWFPGHLWQVALCGICLHHLGWYFTSGRNAFFGLILDQLILPV